MKIKNLAIAAGSAMLAITLIACGSSAGSGDTTTAMATTSTSAMAPTSSMVSSMPATSAASTAMPATSAGSTEMATTMGMSGSASGSADAGLVGPGCADYAKAVPSGAGSVAGMAVDPVATAASHNPLLTTLVAAVSGKVNAKVDLVNTLNSGQFTVFAPVDDAFKAIDSATMGKLATDDALLTKILTYHVIAGQLDPAAVVGEHKTVEGATVTVTGSGNDLKVNGASVICGGVKTKNATVYLIDKVLMPPM